MAKPHVADLLKELTELADAAKEPLRTKIIIITSKLEDRLVGNGGDARQLSWTEERRQEQGKRIAEAWEKKRQELRFLFTIHDREEVMRFVLSSWEEASNAWGCGEHSLRMHFSRSGNLTLWKMSKVHECYVALSRLPSGTALDKEQFLKDLKAKKITLSDYEIPRLRVAK